MFTADSRIKQLPAQPESIVAIYSSVNRPPLTLPGKANQPVQAAVVGISSGRVFGVFIHLFLTQSMEALVYVDKERSTVLADAYKALEEDGLAFVESLGFIMEPLNFREMKPEEQSQVIASLPCFKQDFGDLAQSARRDIPDTPQLRLARLVAAF